jgi:hypothetical protein
MATGPTRDGNDGRKGNDAWEAERVAASGIHTRCISHSQALAIAWNVTRSACLR